MKRVSAILTVMVLTVFSIVQSASAVRPNAVIDLFLSKNLPGTWEKTDIYRVEGVVNYHDYEMYINTNNGKITEIVFRGWFDDLQTVPRPGINGYTWSDGISVSYAFAYTLYDLGLFDDVNFPDGTAMLAPDDTYPILQRGWIGESALNNLKASWKNVYVNKGRLEATNKTTGVFFMLRGWEYGEFEVYVRLP